MQVPAIHVTPIDAVQVPTVELECSAQLGTRCQWLRPSVQHDQDDLQTELCIVAVLLYSNICGSHDHRYYSTVCGLIFIEITPVPL